MLKNALFLEKAEKIAAASRWPPAAGGSASKPSSCYSQSTYVLLLSTAQISRHRYNYDLLSHT